MDKRTRRGSAMLAFAIFAVGCLVMLESWNFTQLTTLETILVYGGIASVAIMSLIGGIIGISGYTRVKDSK